MLGMIFEINMDIVIENWNTLVSVDLKSFLWALSTVEKIIRFFKADMVDRLLVYGVLNLILLYNIFYWRNALNTSFDFQDILRKRDKI